MTPNDAITAARRYIEGVADQDGAGLAALFAETAVITGLDEGTWSTVPRDRWIAFICAPERRGAGGRDFGVRSIVIEDTVATIVIETLFNGRLYHDMLVVGAHPEGLRILCKAYHQLPRT
jgi:hypothetical protein